MENRELVRSVERLEVPKVKNIFEMDNMEKQEFGNRVRANDGSMIIFVHPFDNLNYEPRQDAVKKFRINDSKIADVSQGFYKLLERNTVKDKPILVFEEDQFLRDTANFVRNKITKGNTAYMMSTQSGDPEPMIIDYNKEKDRSKFEEIKKRNWKGLTDWLKESGVKEVVIGGKYLLIEEGGLDGCVGETVKHLMGEGINVKITNLCHPDKGCEEMG